MIQELSATVIDVNNLERSAAFWTGLSGRSPDKTSASGDDWLSVGSLGGSTWFVLQRVPERKTVKNRVHLHFRVDDVEKEIARIIELGGSQKSEVRAISGVTMADPEGNEFCIGKFPKKQD